MGAGGPFRALRCQVLAFTRALIKWDEIATHPSPEAWIVRTALNLHRDRWRSSQRMQRVRQRREPVGVVDIVDPALLAAVRNLPERQREVVALRALLACPQNRPPTNSASMLAPSALTCAAGSRRYARCLTRSNRQLIQSLTTMKEQADECRP